MCAMSIRQNQNALAVHYHAGLTMQRAGLQTDALSTYPARWCTHSVRETERARLYAR